jgi:uncharacterized membrane protein
MFFSDAVVAIALTLLILPLADAVPEAISEHKSSLDVITENSWKIFSFLLSFVVIAQLWRFHHRLFEHVKAYNQPLVVANLCWLLTIVVLPFPTEMIGGFNHDRFTPVFYISAILASNICQLAMILIIRADPAIAKDNTGISDRRRFASVVNAGLLTVALVLAALLPGIKYYALLLLTLVPLAVKFRYRHTDEAQVDRPQPTDKAPAERPDAGPGLTDDEHAGRNP